MSLEDALLERGFLDQPALERLHKAQGGSADSLVRLMEQLSLVDGAILAAEVASFYGLPMVQEDEWPKVLLLADKLSYTFLREHSTLPIGIELAGLVVAVCDPSDTNSIKAIELATGRPALLRVAPASEISAAIERLTAHDGHIADGEAQPVGSGNEEDIEHLKDLALDAPIIQLVNNLLLDAVQTRATDLHFEPYRARLVVRKRVDGMLREVRSLPPNMGRATISRIKIISGLNIAERRLPQDGRAHVTIDGRDYDLRVATMPTIHGEAVTIRFLSNSRFLPELSKLGLSAKEEGLLREHIMAPFGLILVTGPTGSGKTTTLAAGLRILNETHRKIITVEDPVEYQIDGINQLQVNPEIGVTFASALRSFLRHDPDVLMIGEMRDSETAHIATHAALTGHLVLTTLHTNSAAAAVVRLLDMGVGGYLLASSLRCVVAQRLVRVLCAHCRQSYEGVPDLPPKALAEVGWNPDERRRLWHAQGCERCYHSGYLGRVAIFEVMDVNGEITGLIKENVTADRIHAAARQLGMTSMGADGIAKCEQGITTVDEVRRVVLEL